MTTHLVHPTTPLTAPGNKFFIAVWSASLTQATRDLSHPCTFAHTIPPACNALPFLLPILSVWSPRGRVFDHWFSSLVFSLLCFFFFHVLVPLLDDHTFTFIHPLLTGHDSELSIMPTLQTRQNLSPPFQGPEMAP